MSMSTFTLDPSAPGKATNILECNAFLEPDKLDTWRGYVWRFGFGAVGTTTVYVLTDRETIEDALETAAEWLKDNAPGVFTEPDYEDAARELGYSPDTEDETEQEAIRECAETDHTYTESGYLLSWEWTVDELPAGPERDAVLLEWLRSNDADDCDAPAWWEDDAGTDCAGDLTA
jgi:hypothetical protein